MRFRFALCIEQILVLVYRRCKYNCKPTVGESLGFEVVNWSSNLASQDGSILEVRQGTRKIVMKCAYLSSLLSHLWVQSSVLPPSPDLCHKTRLLVSHWNELFFESSVNKVNLPVSRSRILVVLTSLCVSRV